MKCINVYFPYISGITCCQVQLRSPRGFTTTRDSRNSVTLAWDGIHRATINTTDANSATVAGHEFSERMGSSHCVDVNISHQFFFWGGVYIKRHSISIFLGGCILKVGGFPKDSHWSFRWFMSCTRTCFYLYLVVFCRGVVKADKDWLKSHQQINCTQICPPQVSLFSTTSSITCHYATYDASNAYQRGDRVTWTFTIPSLYDGSIHRASLPTDGHQPGTSNSGVYLATLRCERNRAGSAGYIDVWVIKWKSQERYSMIKLATPKLEAFVYVPNS